MVTLAHDFEAKLCSYSNEDATDDARVKSNYATN